MSNLTASSVICMLCYKYFQSVMQQLLPIGMPTTCVSTNDLIPLVQCCHQNYSYTDQKGEILVKMKFMCQSAQTLAAVMKADEAMLLSRLYQEFLGMIQIESKHYPSLSLTEETWIPSCCWVLCRLHSMFGESLTIVWKHDRYGTLHFATINLPGMWSITINTALLTLYMYMCTCNISPSTYHRNDTVQMERENGKLEIHVDWEVTENMDKAKASLDFVLSGCKCKTGCKTRISSCRKERECGPSCCCHFCTNTCNETQTNPCTLT